MNGWADAEPAWWLNLQAKPDATVGLADGSRAVRARAAVGEDRERLWAKFRGYSGWGDDIDGLATRRSRETAVVLLEPASGPPDSRVMDHYEHHQQGVPERTEHLEMRSIAQARQFC